MDFVEDLTPYFAQFGQSATLAGAPLRAIVDSETVTDFDALTQSPTAVVKTADAGSAAAGQAFVSAAISYTVRQVLRQPPDGALTRLVLARA